MDSRSRLLVVAVVSAGLLAAVPARAGSTALKDLMKKMGQLTTAGDLAGIAPLLDKAKTMKPNDPDYADWEQHIDEVRAAAGKGDATAVKAACKHCHDKHRNDYKTKYGSKAP